MVPTRLKADSILATYDWQWQGQPVTVTYETLGQGPSVLLLPAFSTVSSRFELTALAQRLAAQFQVITLDWPGFGDSSRDPLDYRPELYRSFLADFKQAICPEPVAAIAAGHAAGYAISLIQSWSHLILVAPTWQGPLAVMGAPQSVRSGVRSLIRIPLIGQALYGLNTQPGFLKWMYRRHVFTDESQLTPEFIAVRHQNTQQPNARYAPAAFVTGGIDPVQNRSEFLDPLKSASVPLMVIVGEQAPPTSRAEMEAAAALPNVQVLRMPGSLGMAEEFGPTVAEAILSFLAKSESSG